MGTPAPGFEPGRLATAVCSFWSSFLLAKRFETASSPVHTSLVHYQIRITPASPVGGLRLFNPIARNAHVFYMLGMHEIAIFHVKEYILSIRR